MEPHEGIGEGMSFEGPDFGAAFSSAGEAGATLVRPRARPLPESERERPVPWRVVLLDDDDHTYEYVMRMVQTLFGHPIEQAFRIAKAVDTQGRAVCMTTHRELAELKAEQIHGFGPDPMMARSAGPMTAVIEPAECEGDPGGSDAAGNRGSAGA